MSVSRPALQQLPRGRLVRDAFIPREGNVMADFDYDQLEARLTAHFSGDPGMIEAFAEADGGAGDFFTLLARRLTGNPDLQKEAKERQDTKQACYGTIYGAGVATFARRAGVDIPAAQIFLDSYYAAFPKIKELQHGVQALAKRRQAEEGVPYIFTPWGRRLTGDEDTIYALVNYLIQGTAADLFKQKVVDLDNAGLLGYAVLPVHDELLFDVPKEEAEDLVHEVEAIMSETERFLVPLTCSGSVGATWGEVH
jgi:DNA polymerase-1